MAIVSVIRPNLVAKLSLNDLILCSCFGLCYAIPDQLMPSGPVPFMIMPIYIGSTMYSITVLAKLRARPTVLAHKNNFSKWSVFGLMVIPYLIAILLYSKYPLQSSEMFSMYFYQC